MSEKPAVVDVSDVTFAAGGRRLLDGVSLHVNEGEIVGVLGANGAGKSTLLKVVTGEWAAGSGSVRIHGRDIRSLAAHDLAGRRAVVAQSSSLSFAFTAREVVLLGATVPGFGTCRPDQEQAANRALADVGLTDLAHQSYLKMSGGERQRVQIARALCQLRLSPPHFGAAPLLCLDEPTASLDLSHQRLVFSTIRRMTETGVAVIAVLHDINLAAAFCDRIVIMKSGRVLATGRPHDVIESSVLSTAYDCPIEANQLPRSLMPFVLPVTA